MIEQQIEDRLRAAVADEPPLGFDPDELVDRAVRLRRRRRSVLASVGATSAIALVAVAVVVTGRTDQSQVAATSPQPPPSATSSTAGGCPGPGGVPPLGFPGSEAAVARLDEVAPQVVREHTGTAFEPSETGMIAYDCPPNIGTVYGDQTGVGAVTLYLVHAENAIDLDVDLPYVTGAVTSEETRGDGSVLRVHQADTQVGVRFDVVHLRPDGVVVAASGPLTEHLTLDALTGIATDPRLTF